MDDDQALTAIDDATWSSQVSPAPAPEGDHRFFRGRTVVDDVLVAELDGRVAGYVAVRQGLPIPSHDHVLEVAGLAVDPGSQGRGVGQTLVDAAVDEARRRGARKLTLRVLGHNQAARACTSGAVSASRACSSGEFHARRRGRRRRADGSRPDLTAPGGVSTRRRTRCPRGPASPRGPRPRAARWRRVAVRRRTSSAMVCGARRSKWTRFLATLPSGTRVNQRLGPPQPGASTNAFSGVESSSSSPPSAAAQNEPTTSASAQSKLTDFTKEVSIPGP